MRNAAMIACIRVVLQNLQDKLAEHTRARDAWLDEKDENGNPKLGYDGKSPRNATEWWSNGTITELTMQVNLLLAVISDLRPIDTQEGNHWNKYFKTNKA